MCIGHRRAFILVPQQLLDRPDIVAVLQQVRREGVLKHVAAGWLYDTRLPDPVRRCPLEHRFVQVVPPPT